MAVDGFELRAVRRDLLMCGIAGVVAAQGASRNVVDTMLARLVHRGPDESGVASLPGCTLGARRLAVIDLVAGQQPVFGETNDVAAVCNGEIYNFRELRAELIAAGHRFRSAGDTEVIAHAYEAWGRDFVARLHGMFALAVWDAPNQTLLLARDRFGKKPLFYAAIGPHLYFASEIQALLAVEEVPRSVDHAAIGAYLAFGYIPAPSSGFTSIRKIEPAHISVVQNGSVRTSRYWQLRVTPKHTLRFGDATERFRVLFDAAVSRRLIADVPLGVLLSGGMDSSAVVASMSRQNGRVSTFSVGFREAAYDELRYARLVARRFDTDHHEFVVEPRAAEILPELVRHFGEPFADSSAIATYYVAREARRHVTVVLNGDGGDELFGGYLRYRGALVADLARHVPGAGSAFARMSGLVPQRSGRSLADRMLRFLRAVSLPVDSRYAEWVSFFPGPLAHGLIGEGRHSGAAELISRAAQAAGAIDPAERAMAADLMTYLPGDLLVKMDVTTMANSLEARSPFLDHELAEFVARLPRSYRVDLVHSKRLLRAAMKDELPTEILRRRKMGFGVPVGDWLRGPLRHLIVETLLAPDARCTTYVRRDWLVRLASDHHDRRIDRTSQLWSLLMLELWLRDVVGSTADMVAKPLRIAQTR